MSTISFGGIELGRASGVHVEISMIEDQWMTSTHSLPMVEFIAHMDVRGRLKRGKPKASPRRLRLFAAAIWQMRCVASMGDKDDMTCYHRAVALADGIQELPRLGKGLIANAWSRDANTFYYPLRENARKAAWGMVAGESEIDTDDARMAAGLARHIFGNPYHPYPPREFPLPIKALAQLVYDEGSGIPMLIDALEEIGCSGLAQHFRERYPCLRCFGKGTEKVWPSDAHGDSHAQLCEHCNPETPRTIAGFAGPDQGWEPAESAHPKGCWVLDLLRGVS